MRYSEDIALAAIAALGFEIELPRPVRPGDRLTLLAEPTEKRDSESNPKAGIARTGGTLTNRSAQAVLAVVTTGLFAKRP